MCAELGRTEDFTAEGRNEADSRSIDSASDAIESEDSVTVQSLVGVVVACEQSGELSKQAEAEKGLRRDKLSASDPSEEEPGQTGEEGADNSEAGELEIRNRNVWQCHEDHELKATEH